VKEGENNALRVFPAFLILALIFLGFHGDSVASQTEGIYVDTSTSLKSIYDEANCHGAPDGFDAYISGPISSNLDTWTFYFANTSHFCDYFDSAQIYITHWVSGHQNGTFLRLSAPLIHRQSQEPHPGRFPLTQSKTGAKWMVLR